MQQSFFSFLMTNHHDFLCFIQSKFENHLNSMTTLLCGALTFDILCYVNTLFCFHNSSVMQISWGKAMCKSLSSWIAACLVIYYKKNHGFRQASIWNIFSYFTSKCWVYKGSKKIILWVRKQVKIGFITCQPGPNLDKLENYQGSSGEYFKRVIFLREMATLSFIVKGARIYDPIHHTKVFYVCACYSKGNAWIKKPSHRNHP